MYRHCVPGKKRSLNWLESEPSLYVPARAAVCLCVCVHTTEPCNFAEGDRLLRDKLTFRNCTLRDAAPHILPALSLTARTHTPTHTHSLFPNDRVRVISFTCWQHSSYINNYVIGKVKLSVYSGIHVEKCFFIPENKEYYYYFYC